MEGEPEQECDFLGVIDTLNSMFADVMSKDVIFTVVESCGGDLNLSVEAIMSITSDAGVMVPVGNQTNEAAAAQSAAENKINNNTTKGSAQQENKNILTQTTTSTTQSPISYATASASTGAVPKQTQNIPKLVPCLKPVWTDQLRRIMTYHNQGSRILIFMRGVPGSGKTFLAKQMVEMMIGNSFNDYKTHIYSTDDFFMLRGSYQYNKYKLGEAHDWNQKRVRNMLREGLSPVIIDNTNVELWEMEPYLRNGVQNGYFVEIVEPSTPWAKKPNQLIRRNTHNVPKTTIVRMLENYQDCVTGEQLRKHYGLSYPGHMVPPVLRKNPAVSNVQANVPSQSNSDIKIEPFAISNIPLPTDHPIEQPKTVENKTPEEPQETCTNENNPFKIQSQAQINTEDEVNSINVDDLLTDVQAEIAKQKRYLEIQKQMEEMDKVEQEWENGESWGEQSQETVSSTNEQLLIDDPKPPRTKHTSESSSSDEILETVKKCEDWRQMALYMPPWNVDAVSQQSIISEVPAETKSSSTCIETGDIDLQNPPKNMKIIFATPRDINLFYKSLNREKIPEKRMLDKSSMTNELLITEAYRCKNEEQHFSAFRKLFKTIPKAALRDVFDKCCGDVNWAVDIILDSLSNNELQNVNTEDLSDEEEGSQEQCNCMAAYNIVPDMQEIVTDTDKQENILEKPLNLASPLQRKVKSTPSASSVQLKRQIEKNFVISDDYYSQHCLKIRKMRRGEYDPDKPDSLPGNAVVTNEIIEAVSEDDNLPSSSKDCTNSNVDNSDDDDSNAISFDEPEKTVNVNLGKEFVAQLDELFARKGMTYPDYVVPRINIPLSLLNEINAFWIESLMYQLDEHDKHNARMLKEDADFARQLATKEAELARAGKEPEVPDFKEIMDMEFALSLYQKDVAEWRNKEPNDLAAKLTREKLYNLFPDTAQDILAELLLAHDNNFQATVEVMLMSTGKAEILEEKNGLNKFLMEKEMKRQEKLLEEEKKTLSEVEWPLLPKGEKADMSMVNEYRDQANMHLARRNLYYQKARDCINRGMTPAAQYYSDIAVFHKSKFEQANSMAAVTLMQIHSSSCDNATIDLHYLRVGEAKETLDLFLDTHIQKLKETKGSKYHTLYFITGRGLHSNGRPRVKPAVRKRLQERGIAVFERNPGLLTAKVSAEDKLSYQS